MSFQRAKSALLGTRFADLRSIAETGSTNADMRTMLATAGLAGVSDVSPIVLVAEHQSAGRGRLDRTWQAPPGSSVLMSIGMGISRLPAERRSLLSTCVALAVTDATGAAGADSVKIKWPNDLVVDTPEVSGHTGGEPAGPGYRKLGGILAELHQLDGVGDVVVLGLGLNVNWPEIPTELASIATSLNRVVGHELDREDLVVDILVALDRIWLPALEGAATPTALFAAYRERSATLDRQVRVELPGGVLVGRASEVTEDGALMVVDTEGEPHTVTVGDVVHLRPAD